VADSPDKVQHNNKGQQPEHGDLYHYVYVFGATLGVGLIDFLFFWHDNHLIALLIGAAWLALVSIFELRHYRKWQIGVPIGWFAAALIAYWIIGPVHRPEVEVSGLLQPGNDPVPVNPCVQGTNKQPTFSVLFGANAFQVPSTGQFAIFRRADRAILSAEMAPEGLAIDADIFGLSGSLVGRIVRNEFHVVTSDKTFAERRGDLSTLAVLDGSNNELLYVRYMNPLTIRVRGIFAAPGKKTVRITDESLQVERGPGFAHNCFGPIGTIFKMD
jgi:hypothetical protein